ncbi:MAG: hypothetical protein OIF40_09695 [Mangrovicoccus sp.]|nr:hypothetical protein [Mangrovicoccus sp.]
MKVGDFIRETLLEIIRGVEEAGEQSSTAIAPSSIDEENTREKTSVNFEIQVLVDSKASGGLRVLQFAEANAEANKQSSQKVSFEVPIYFGTKWKRDIPETLILSETEE